MFLFNTYNILQKYNRTSKFNFGRRPIRRLLPWTRQAKDPEYDNIEDPNEWIEEAISKKHIKYYEYEHFSNIEKIGFGAFGKVYRANWRNKEQYLALKSFFNHDKATTKEIVEELKL
ncbi:hypothetical protein GLOIN_2v1845867 [Rhizophagus irregularis DAOM 181602=DAOM 197198]|uniref:Protein kinase domain-containing protein n=1 Tax=Rhizophagus irregularis (strain DAOM 181602 / DAOM 197198 / MUCL 43194) TaxID=747089 RepID=A0A2P4PDN1_RHIID|nr:hypothetical protein GLOIN_2v1845867 [Rhizophagus irregularis DAOM 181602=DAOM 197198]POG63506.1 hypothetical protein GLOIN_2v1845867 [Rhizophagus irregularis DAOM 181602=DAOM 197198]|eukprot:XP_025170372.1 hypothetical protein GLOIN_2v1845867 [Rhizophagus irregularis DAOM 181602=DAOM 197198]